MWGRPALKRVGMQHRPADHVPDQLQRRVQSFLTDAPSARAVRNAGKSVFLGTSVGAVRERNEDRAIVVRACYMREPERDFVLAALSDGMGGLENGEEAAIVTLSTFIARTIRTARLPPDQRLYRAALDANEAVYQLYRGRSGATLSAVLVERRFGSIGVNVGDSRIYLLRDIRLIEQLSRDDTLGEFVRDRAGFNAIDRTGSLIQHIGIGEGLEPHIIDAGATNSKYHFVLTSDGIHRNKELFSVVIRETSSLYHLVDRLLLLAELSGGHDNATAVVLPDLMDSDHNRSLEFALSLEFFSPFKEAELWISEIGDYAERKQIAHAVQHPPEAHSPEPTPIAPPEPPPAVREEGPELARTKSRTRKTRKTQKPKASVPKEQPEHPQAKIEFPKVD
jgi:PPM family protein phosphatase